LTGRVTLFIGVLLPIEVEEEEDEIEELLILDEFVPFVEAF
jgi:hypothetical protein